MDAEQIARRRRHLWRPWPLVGPWLRRRAVRALVADGSPAAAAVLAEALAVTPDDALVAPALAGLRQVTAQPAIDAVCRVWATTRHGQLAGLLAEKNWIARNPSAVAVLTALHARHFGLFEEGGAELVRPLVEACADTDGTIAQAAREGLRHLRESAAIDALCACWAEGRDRTLREVIVEQRWVARRPVSARVLSALLTDQGDLLAAGAAEIVGPLLEAGDDPDEQLALRARAALGTLTNPEARDAVCRRVIERNDPLAREVALAAGYAPKEPQARALFFFLTGQWQHYETLDFDYRLLSAAYAAASGKLRGRLAEAARRAGRSEWVTVVAQGRQDRRLGELSAEEWETTQAVLVENARWPELWRLAQRAPVDWSVRFLLQLREAGWRPAAVEEAKGFAHLVELAGGCAREGPATGETAPPALGRLLRLQRRLEGHTAPVSCLAVSEDGRRLASGSNDQTVRLWGLQGPLAVMSGHTDWVACLAWSPTGGLIASGGPDRTVRLWSAADGQLVARLPGHDGGVRCIGFRPDGLTLITGGEDRMVRLWRVPSGQALTALEGHDDVVSCLAVSGDGALLATGSYDQSARLWRLPGGESAARLTGHKGLINGLAFAPDGQSLVTASKDRCLMLWGLPAGDRLTRIKGHKDDVNCLALSPDGRLIASGSWDNTVRLWRLPGGSLVEVLGSTGTMDGHTAWVTCLAFTPDGTMLASGSLDNTVRLWSVTEGRPVVTLAGHRERISCLAILPDGRTLVSGSWDGTLCVWQSELDRLRRFPLAETTLDDLTWAQETLGDPRLSAGERAWVELLSALMHWRRRHDILLEEKAPITVGEFDIEIEG